MSPTETLHNAAEATRSYAKGIDRATAIRRLFAVWLVLTLVVSIVPPVGPASAEAYTLADASFAQSEPHSINAERDIEIADNGTRLYVADAGNDTIIEYNLSTPYDLSTLTQTHQLDVSGQSDFPRGLMLGPSGEKLYWGDGGSNTIYQYDLGTAYDLSTASDSGNTFMAGDTPEALDMGPDGEHFVLYYPAGDELYSYNLTASGNISEATLYTNQSGLPNTANGIAISDDGTTLFTAQSTAGAFEYNLSSPWNVSEGSLTQQSSDGGIQDSFIDFDDTGNRLFGINSTHVNKYEMFDHTVSGTVKYDNGTVVDGASISVNASTVSDQTDANGEYSVGLDNGTYEITAIKDIVDGATYTGTTTVTVSGSDVTNANITVTRDAEVELDVPTQMFPNETAAYKVYDVQADGSKVDITDSATVTSSDPTNLTVNQTSHELESTSDTSFAGEITITATFQDDSAERNVTVANLSAGNVGLMQNAADMTAAIWGDVPDAQGDRPGGTQLTMRILFVALLIGAAIATHASGFAGIGGITLIVVMGWFMGWVTDGMALVTVFTGLFIGLNLAANIDYSVRK